MRQRIVKIAICAIVSVIVGTVAFTVVDVEGSPGMLSHPHWLWGIAMGGALFYVVIPVIILVLISIFRGVPSVGLSIVVAICWLTVIFAWWVYKPLAHYGVFPWWGFRRHYLEMLPVPLSFGFAFGICARALSGPNNSSSDSQV
jgi:hypothetical protein